MCAARNRSETTMVPTKDRHQLSLMHVFRAAHARRDSRKASAAVQDGDRELTERSKERRGGTDEETLRKHLNYDMASLMNTVNLDAVVPLDDYPYLAKSIVNFGFGDLSHMSDSDKDAEAIAALIRTTLLTFEPRLIADTLEVRLAKEQDGGNERMTFDITAEMYASPADIPLSFVAEVDDGAGKIQMTKLRVAT